MANFEFGGLLPSMNSTSSDVQNMRRRYRGNQTDINLHAEQWLPMLMELLEPKETRMRRQATERAPLLESALQWASRQPPEQQGKIAPLFDILSQYDPGTLRSVFRPSERKEARVFNLPKKMETQAQGTDTYQIPIDKEVYDLPRQYTKSEEQAQVDQTTLESADRISKVATDDPGEQAYLRKHLVTEMKDQYLDKEGMALVEKFATSLKEGTEPEEAIANAIKGAPGYIAKPAADMMRNMVGYFYTGKKVAQGDTRLELSKEMVELREKQQKELNGWRMKLYDLAKNRELRLRKAIGTRNTNVMLKELHRSYDEYRNDYYKNRDYQLKLRSDMMRMAKQAGKEVEEKDLPELQEQQLMTEEQYANKHGVDLQRLQQSAGGEGAPTGVPAKQPSALPPPAPSAPTGKDPVKGPDGIWRFK